MSVLLNIDYMVDFLVICKCVLVWGEPPSFFQKTKSEFLNFCHFKFFSVHVYVCVGGWLYVLSVCAEASKRKKMESYSLELQLQVVVSHYVGAGDRVKVLCKSTKCLITELSF